MIALLLASWITGGAPTPTPATRPGASVRVPAQRSAPAPDAWFAEDKARHFLMSFAVTTLGYGAARAAGLDRDPARLAGAVGSAVAGLGKEVYDRKASRFSVRDLVWDALGIGVGVVFVHNIR